MNYHSGKVILAAANTDAAVPCFVLHTISSSLASTTHHLYTDVFFFKNIIIIIITIIIITFL